MKFNATIFLRSSTSHRQSPKEDEASWFPAVLRAENASARCRSFWIIRWMMCCLRCGIGCLQNREARIRYAIALIFRRSIQRSQSNLSIMYFGRFPVPGRMMCGIARSRIMSYIMPTESPTYTTDCLGGRSRFSAEIGTVLKRCWRLTEEAPDGVLFIPSSTTDCLGVGSRFSGEIGTVLRRC